MKARSAHPAVVIALVLAAGLLQACGGQGAAVEGELLVTKFDDTFDGACLPRDCSLREAIAAANDAPGADVIRLPAGRYTLRLAGAGEDGSAAGDLDLTDDTTILGAGIEGEGTFIVGASGFGDRLLHVVGGSAVLEGVYLGGGAADTGGAVRVERGASLTLRQVRLDASRASSAGGLVSNEGTLIVEGSRLTNGCAAGPGGALHNLGTATLRESVLEDNESTGPGGAIANDGRLTIEATSIARAFAGSGVLCGVESVADGGGIHNTADLVVRQGEIVRSEATGRGGAVFTSGTVAIEGTMIRSVAGDSGGGVAVAAGGRATLTGVDIESSARDGDGGGLLVASGASATVVDSLIAGVALRSGGGMANLGDLTVRGSTVTLSRAANGAGVHSAGTLSMETTTVRQNSAFERGGGAQVLGTTTINASTFAGNTADFGGGLFLQGNATVTNCTVSGNNGTTSGGGVVVWGSGNLTITHCTITHNASPSGSALLADTYATISNSIFGANTLGPNCEIRRAPVAIGNLDQDGSCGFAAADNLVGTAAMLGPLGDNGGPTQTHLLLADSPARNTAVTAVCLPADQRGIVRPQEGLCDIGAVEMEAGS